MLTPSLILLPSIPKPHLFLHWPGLLISIWLDCLLVTWVKTYEQSWKEYSYIFSDLSNRSMRYFFQEEKLREPGILISFFLFTRSAQNDRNYKPLLDSAWCNFCWVFFRAILPVLLRMHCWFTDSSSSFVGLFASNCKNPPPAQLMCLCLPCAHVPIASCRVVPWGNVMVASHSSLLLPTEKTFKLSKWNPSEQILI